MYHRSINNAMHECAIVCNHLRDVLLREGDNLDWGEYHEMETMIAHLDEAVSKLEEVDLYLREHEAYND